MITFLNFNINKNIMAQKRKINAQELMNSESEILKRIASEVIDSEVSEIVSGHSSSTSGHRSGSSHSSHSSAMREKVNKRKDK
jgi:Ribonuclease G/E